MSVGAGGFWFSLQHRAAVRSPPYSQSGPIKVRDQVRGLVAFRISVHGSHPYAIKAQNKAGIARPKAPSCCVFMA